MKIPLSKIIDKALSGNKTLYFSKTSSDVIIHHKSKSASAIEQKKELEKAETYNKQMLPFFILIYFTNAPHDVSKINKSKLDLLDCVKIITGSILKSQKPIVPSFLFPEFDLKFFNKIRRIMIQDYKYNSSWSFDWLKIENLYRAFYANWDKLIMDSRLKKSNPSDVDYESIFF